MAVYAGVKDVHLQAIDPARHPRMRGTMYRAPTRKQKSGAKDYGCDRPCEVLGLRRGGGSHGGVADGVTVDDELDAAGALGAFGGVICGERAALSQAAGGGGGGPRPLASGENAGRVGAGCAGRAVLD